MVAGGVLPVTFGTFWWGNLACRDSDGPSGELVRVSRTFALADSHDQCPEDMVKMMQVA
jgi:hypothetical protein